MSNTAQATKTVRSPRLLPLLIVTFLLTVFVLSLNYTMLSAGKLLDVTGTIHDVLQLDRIPEKVPLEVLTQILSILLQLLYLRIGLVLRTKLCYSELGSEPPMKNKMFAGTTFLVWGWFFLWAMMLCDPDSTNMPFLSEAAKVVREWLGISIISDSILTKVQYVTLWGSVVADVLGIYFVIGAFADDIRASKKEQQEKKAKETGTQKGNTTAERKKEAPAKKEKPKTQTKQKVRSGVSAMDPYAASAADERLKKYMDSIVPTAPRPCIRVKLLSTSDVMEHEVIRPFGEDGSLFISLDCGSFTYELAFRLDENGQAYLLGDEDEPLSPDAPHAACIKIDGKSVPQSFIEYIKV